MGPLRRLSLVLPAVGLACVTVNVYFPEAAIKELSLQIEEEIERRAAEESPPQVGSLPRPGRRVATAAGPASFGLATAAWAAETDVAAPEVTNPAIRKIIESRAQRVEAIGRFKGMGVLGENSKALLEVRSLDSLADLRQRAEVQRLVKEENDDRGRLFTEIAAAKGVDLSQLPRIQETYAETLREKASPGDWIQLADGSWTQKKAAGGGG